MIIPFPHRTVRATIIHGCKIRLHRVIVNECIRLRQRGAAQRGAPNLAKENDDADQDAAATDFTTCYDRPKRCGCLRTQRRNEPCIYYIPSAPCVMDRTARRRHVHTVNAVRRVTRRKKAAFLLILGAALNEVVDLLERAYTYRDRENALLPDLLEPEKQETEGREKVQQRGFCS